MSASNVVIVESPAKAKTINKYLGPDYEVIASYGHVRDLVNKDGSVLPDDNFAMRWEIGERADKPIREISKAVKKATSVFLATDPDREGEAISWHVQQILNDEGLLKGKTVQRVTFNEITKKAVQEAFNKGRKLDQPLIEAYMARRALDYLVGFTLSPILWRKLPGSRSAGRVQSVALRIICERETEIEAFRAQEYWSIETRLHTPEGAPFTARLTHLSGNKLDKFDIASAEDAEKAVGRIRLKNLIIQKIEKKQARRNPSPPFITSSLQMEGSRKLRISASQTMRLAQRLYEDGHITYMRTDGTTLSEDAVTQARQVIGKEYGDQYVPSAPRLYKSKAKNAQEAHEAIRPTDLSKLPSNMRGKIAEEQWQLYDLIWKRTVASQMESAVLDQVVIDISDGTDDVILRANGSVVTFDGFLTLYKEDESDDEDVENEQDRRLPPMNEGDKTKIVDVTPNQHFTQAPPRYSEASLVKRLEELGIGRPSTYASIMQVLRDRDYVTLENRRFIPQDRGRIVTTFLHKFFAKYVDYDFTANLEEELDAIAGGHVLWREALRQFWVDFKAAIDETKNLTITQVIDELDAELGPHFFAITPENPTPRKCQACSSGTLGLKLGKFGAFIGCSNYPECKFTRPLLAPVAGEEGEDKDSAALSNEPKVLGLDPGTGRTITLRRGPYGPYVQIDPPPESKDKPKRQGLPRGTNIADVDLAMALKLLSLPRDVGKHPETGEMIQAGIGRFGPFLKHEGKFSSLPKGDDVLTVGMNRAVEVIAVAAERAKNRPPRKTSFKGKGKGKEKPESDAKPATKPKAQAKAKAKAKKKR
ncbi:MAG: type I DNA topoisomerase [Alphaproteobacteria bacterium]